MKNGTGTYPAITGSRLEGQEGKHSEDQVGRYADASIWQTSDGNATERHNTDWMG